MNAASRTTIAALPEGFEVTACPKCGERKSRVVLVGRDHLHHLDGRYEVAECEGCAFWYLSPRPTSAHLASLYPADYAPHGDPVGLKPSPGAAAYLAREYGYAHLAEARRPERSVRERLQAARLHWQTYVNLIPRYVDGGSLLEIGSASGARLLALRELGWTDLHGIELVEAAAERARAQGLEITCGPVEESLDRYADGSLDVIVTSMVLEHLANPFEVVAKIATKLRPGGQFLFSTITRDSLDARMYGEYWTGFDFPRHLVYFRDADIEDMVGEHFDVLQRARHPAPQDFARAATWRAGEGRLIDKLVLAVSNPRVTYNLALALAWAGQSCRVSYRCQRKS